VIVQAATNGLRMGPAAYHVGSTEPDELSAGIRKFLQRMELDLVELHLPDLDLLQIRPLHLDLIFNLTLRLRRTRQDKTSDHRCGIGTKKMHDGTFQRCSAQRAATMMDCGEEATIGEP
jgi:hypothetical protein